MDAGLLADLVALFDKVASAGVDTASVAELLETQWVLERVYRQIPAVQHRVMAAIKAQASPGGLGARSWKDALAIRLRLSSREAGRRLAEGELLAPRCTVTGQPLAPVCPVTAEAQARGEVTGEHVRIITKTMKKIPARWMTCRALLPNASWLNWPRCMIRAPCVGWPPIWWRSSIRTDRNPMMRMARFVVSCAGTSSWVPRMLMG